MRCLALAFATLAVALAPAASASGGEPPALAQVNAPNVPPPPVVTPRRPVPQPLANRPERTLPPAEAQDTPAPGDAGPVEPDMLVVSLPGGADVPAAEIARAHGLALVAESRIGLIDRRVLRLRIPDGRPLAEVLQALSGDARLAAVQPSFLYELQGGAAPQYTVEKLALARLHRTARGEGVVVALIDTGVDTAHAALRGARLESLSVLDGPGARPGDHATRMAGILVARHVLTGVAPAAELVAIEAFSQPAADAAAPHSHSLAVARALDRAAGEGAQVVNLSFAGGRDPLVGQALDVLAKRGVVLVAADALFRRANRGDYVSLAAPGVNILAPAAGGRFMVASGTSAAAAHVSGVVALILGRAPELRPTAVRRILARTAKDLGAPGPDPEYGAGLIDPAAALSALPEQVAQPTD